jgi:general secretion pathway protein F
MAAFEFQALDADGKARRGVLEGDTAKSVREQLRERGWTPTEVRALSANAAPAAPNTSAAEAAADMGALSRWFQRGMGRAERAVFTRQFATLVNAGLPLDEVLSVLAEQSERGATQRMVLAIRTKMMEGQSLSRALAQFPNNFDALYCASVKAGEQSSQLHSVLERLAQYCESSAGLTQRVLLALIYPALLLLVCVLVVAGLLSYVVPQLLGMFAQIGGELPLATRTLLALSSAVTQYGKLLLLLFCAAVALFFIMLRQASFRAAWHRLLLRLPLIGALLRAGETARFARTLAIASSASVPVLEALNLSQEVVNLLPIKQAIKDATAKVREGQSLANSLKSTAQFPELLTRLVGSGERSGRLEGMLEHGADLLERRVQNSVTSLLALLEPGMILLMGAIVLGIVLAILQPIFMMNALMNAGVN